MKLSLFELLYGLSEALDHVESEWHPLPKVHAKKTAYFAVRMGECAGLKKEKLYQLALAGLFHDSGITRSQGGLCREKEGTKEELKFRLREYVKSGEAFRVRIDTKKFETAEAVCTFIKKAHEDYLKIEHGVKEDCEYIVRVCHQVVQAILNLVSIAAGKEVERRLCPA